MKTYFLDSAFWRNDDHTAATAIFVTEFESGSLENRQVDLDKFVVTGEPCKMFKKLIEQLGEVKITENTEIRKKKKEEEKRKEKLEKNQQKVNKEFDDLFQAKIQAFDIEAIRKTTNKKLRSKLRRSKNVIELNAYVTMILMESLDNE